MRATRRFEAVPQAIREARQFVSEILAGLSSARIDSVILMVSELATNALLHASTDFAVTIDRNSNRVRVDVTDTGGGDPVVQSPAWTQPRGRGLLIVEEFSDSWGVVPAVAGRGKTVWFILGTATADSSVTA